MNSDERNRCSHWLGFPIRKSPDRRLLASSRGLSQLTTSFIASLRQGIHTHALSSLTIKSTSNTKLSKCSFFFAHPFGPFALAAAGLQETHFLREAALLVLSNARQIFDCQRSDFFDSTAFGAGQTSENHCYWMIRCDSPIGLRARNRLRFASLEDLVGLGRLELSTSPLSGVRSSHLSYRPEWHSHWWSWSGSNRRPPECKSGALPAELQPQKNLIEADWMQGSQHQAGYHSNTSMNPGKRIRDVLSRSGL